MLGKTSISEPTGSSSYFSKGKKSSDTCDMKSLWRTVCIMILPFIVCLLGFRNCALSFNPWNSPGCQGDSAISILQMRKRWFREMKELAQGQRARK